MESYEIIVEKSYFHARIIWDSIRCLYKRKFLKNLFESVLKKLGIEPSFISFIK